VATVPVLYALGARLFGSRVGLIGAFLLALNSYHIRYAQEARSYTLVVFLVTLSSLFFVSGIERPIRRHWLAYVLTSVLAAYSHFFGGLVIAAHWVSLLFLRRRNTPWRLLAASNAVVFLLLLPLGAFVLAKDAGQVDWLSQARPSNVVGLFFVLAGGAGRAASADAVGKLLLLAYFVVSLLAVVAAAREWSSGSTSAGTWRYAFLFAWLFVPVAVAYSVSLVKPIFLARYLIVCLPPLMLIAAVGLSRIRRIPVLTGALVILAALAGYETFRYYKVVENQDWRGATQYLLSQVRSGDAIAFYPRYWRAPFEYYRDRVDGSTLRNEATVVLTDPLESIPSYTRVWFVFVEGDTTPGVQARARVIQDSLAGRYSLVGPTMFTDIAILLYR
jgi:uncharacterized membrane protein